MRKLIFLGFLVLTVALNSADLVGFEMLKLEKHGLQDHYSAPEDISWQYITLITDLSDLYREDVENPRHAFFNRFCEVLKPRYATGRRADLLSRDLVDGQYDCSTLSTMFLDALFMASGKLLEFAVTEHHVLLTDGEYDYDPMRRKITPVSGRTEEVQVGVDPLSLTCRTIALLYIELAGMPSNASHRGAFLTVAQSWFEAGLNYDTPDFMIQREYDDFLAEQAKE